MAKNKVAIRLTNPYNPLNPLNPCSYNYSHSYIATYFLNITYTAPNNNPKLTRYFH